MRSAWTGVVVFAVGLGCGDRSPAPPPDPPPAAATPTPDDEPWRFRPTLEQHLPAEAVAEPVLELSLPREHTAIVLAAVLRSGSDHVSLERWTFEQTPEQTLRLVEGGEALVRLRPGERHRELSELRRSLATPRAVLTRPIGLPGDDPEAVVATLAEAFRTLHDPARSPRERVLAAATVVRGLDDTIVLERDAVWQVAALLDPPPATTAVTRTSERRATVTLGPAEHPATLQLQRKSSGWAIATFDAPTGSDGSGGSGGSGGSDGSGAVVEL